MIHTLYSLLFLFPLGTIHALPPTSTNRLQSSSSSSTTPTTLPSTSTSLKDHPQPLQTLIYHQPRLPQTLPSSSTSPLQPRQPFPNSRPVNTCRSPTAEFLHSHCTHSSAITGSLQSYLIFCREPDTDTDTAPHSDPGRGRNRFPTPPRPTAESGRCGPNEMCANGKVPGGFGDTSMAWCVPKSWYSDVVTWAAEEREKGLGLGGMVANAVISDPGGKTPVRVRGLGLEVEGGEWGGKEGGNQTCRDCFELITPAFGPEVRGAGLRTDVAVAETGAAAGILWLAILSG